MAFSLTRLVAYCARLYTAQPPPLEQDGYCWRSRVWQLHRSSLTTAQINVQNVKRAACSSSLMRIYKLIRRGMEQRNRKYFTTPAVFLYKNSLCGKFRIRCNNPRNLTDRGRLRTIAKTLPAKSYSSSSSPASPPPPPLREAIARRRTLPGRPPPNGELRAVKKQRKASRRSMLAQTARKHTENRAHITRKEQVLTKVDMLLALRANHKGWNVDKLLSLRKRKQNGRGE